MQLIAEEATSGFAEVRRDGACDDGEAWYWCADVYATVKMHHPCGRLCPSATPRSLARCGPHRGALFSLQCTRDTTPHAAAVRTHCSSLLVSASCTPVSCPQALTDRSHGSCEGDFIGEGVAEEPGDAVALAVALGAASDGAGPRGELTRREERRRSCWLAGGPREEARSSARHGAAS